MTARQFLLYLSILLMIAESTSALGERCVEYTNLDSPPNWTFSGAWLGQERLAFVDALYSTVKEYTTDINAPRRFIKNHFDPEEVVSIDKHGDTIRMLPTTITRVGDDRFVARTEEGYLLWLDLLATSDDSSLTFDAPASITAPRNAPPPEFGYSIRYIFDAAIAGKNYILVYADAVSSDGSWRTGFFLVRLTGEGFGAGHTTEFLQDMSNRDDFRGYYTSKYPYIISTDVGAAALVFGHEDNQSHILTVDVQSDTPKIGSLELSLLSGEISRFLPPIPATSWQDERDARKRFARQEALALISGLYFQDGHYNLLTRSPKPGHFDAIEGAHPPPTEPEWQVHTFDLTGRIYGSTTIPTNAPHLVVTPGMKNWAILELASVKRLGEQPVLGLLLLPSSYLQPGGVKQLPECLKIN